jgi:hypothetical protein
VHQKVPRVWEQCLKREGGLHGALEEDRLATRAERDVTCVGLCGEQVNKGSNRKLDCAGHAAELFHKGNVPRNCMERLYELVMLLGGLILMGRGGSETEGVRVEGTAGTGRSARRESMGHRDVPTG